MYLKSQVLTYGEAGGMRAEDTAGSI